jgi:FkbM family methyltransferase
MAPRPEWLTAALEHQRTGRFAEAERICDAVLGANPVEADALHLLGLIAACRDQHERAGTMFARAITYKPNRGDFYASLGNLFFSRGIVVQMADCYRRALLLAHFSTIPAPYAEIIAHAGSDPPASDFTTNVDQYKSQYLQDVLLDRWLFGGVAGGTFVDIGAHDGVAYSNSFVFEKLRGWRGVCIEPNPAVFAQLAVNRQCTTLNCCVSDAAGMVPFLKISGYSEMLSGIVEKYEPEHRERVERELKQFGGSSDVILIQARTLNDIAAECDLAEVTYLSIDTEGSELAILQSIDFKRLFVHAITVEYNFDHVKSRMIALMRGNGFDYVQTLGHDLLFLNHLSPFQTNLQRLRSGH